jgi:hypothetical protein
MNRITHLLHTKRFRCFESTRKCEKISVLGYLDVTPVYPAIKATKSFRTATDRTTNYGSYICLNQW